MQITINTSDILGDEATIRDEVIAQVSNALVVSMKKDAAKELQNMFDAKLKQVVAEKVEELVKIAMDSEFTVVDSYGEWGKTTTIRGRIVDFVKEQCTFKNTGYSSDRNRFSEVVCNTVQEEVEKFATSFQSLVTKQVLEQSMEMAVKKLKESMGIK